MYKKILVPTDGSEYAHKAAEHAINMADMSGAEIIVLYVTEMSVITGLQTKDIIMKLKNRLEEEGRESFDKILNMASEKGDIQLTFEVREGSPSNMILKTVNEKGIDLVVMGTSGKHGWDRFLIGSVTENVMRSARCPVLVVH